MLSRRFTQAAGEEGKDYYRFLGIEDRMWGRGEEGKVLRRSEANLSCSSRGPEAWDCVIWGRSRRRVDYLERPASGQRFFAE